MQHSGIEIARAPFERGVRLEKGPERSSLSCKLFILFPRAGCFLVADTSVSSSRRCFSSKGLSKSSSGSIPVPCVRAERTERSARPAPASVVRARAVLRIPRPAIFGNETAWPRRADRGNTKGKPARLFRRGKIGGPLSGAEGGPVNTRGACPFRADPSNLQLAAVVCFPSIAALLVPFRLVATDLRIARAL